MKKSVLDLVTRLQTKLLEFPSITDRLEKKDPYFVDFLLKWLKETEDIFSTHSISEVAALAGYRAKILSSNYNDTVKISLKKNERKRIASDCMLEIQSEVYKVLNPRLSNIEECRQLLRQLLNIISQNNIIKYDRMKPFDEFITELWNFIIAHEQLKPGAVKLKTFLPMNDIRLLIAEEVQLEDF